MKNDAFKQKRKSLSRRRRRLVFNNDGDDVVRLGKEGKPDALLGDNSRTGTYPVTPEGLLDVRTTNLAGSHVDAIWYWGNSGMKLFFNQDNPFHELYCVEDGPYYQAGYRSFKELQD